MDTLDLDIDEQNELSFRVQVEGADNVPAKVRMVCEGADIAYMFNASSTSEVDVVKFTIPPMKNKINEGVIQSRIEVLIDNKYFSPVQFNINFKRPVRVVAEAFQTPVVSQKRETKVSVVPVERKKQEPIVGSKQITLRDRYKNK